MIGTNRTTLDDGHRAASGGAGIGRGTVLLFAVATGLCVANLYYCQPLLNTIADGLHVSHSTTALLVTFTQLGYAAALVLVLPLGDLANRRRLIPATAAVTAVALAVTAGASSAPVLLASAVVTGAGATTAQLLVPLAAELAGEDARGRVVGTVMSGLLLGILVARTVAGYLAQFGGWRAVYAAAAAVMLVLAAVLAWRLPAAPRATTLRYPALLASTARILREEPVLRFRALLGALGFAVFSVLWTALTFLLSGAPYHYPPGTIGLFGLLGAVGALAAGAAGRVADRGGAGRSTALATALLALSWTPLILGARHVSAIAAGIVLLDLAVQGLHVTNQSQIYRLRPDARSRITSVYMTAYFAGGAAGSALATVVYGRVGWSGVCVLGASLGGAAFLLWLADAFSGRGRDAPEVTRPAEAAAPEP